MDKRGELNVREFGYRSVHLIVQARLKGMEGPAAEPLRDHWFEIQVRSVLEHAWAEIEHEVVYKSGVVYPDDVVRDFANIAAQLEALDQRFLALRAEKAKLAVAYRDSYQQGHELDEDLDAARLSGLMAVARPNGRSFQDLSRAARHCPCRSKPVVSKLSEPPESTARKAYWTLFKQILFSSGSRAMRASKA